MLHEELKIICDQVREINAQEERLRLEWVKLTSHPKNILLRLALIFFTILGVLLFLGGIIGVLREGLTPENSLALFFGAPAIYMWHRETKKIERINADQDGLSEKRSQLVYQLEKLGRNLKKIQRKKLESDMLLINWEGRPAVSISSVEAYAILEPNGHWKKVDAADVSQTGHVVAYEDDFYKIFGDQHPNLNAGGLISNLVDDDKRFDWLTYLYPNSPREN